MSFEETSDAVVLSPPLTALNAEVTLSKDQALPLTVLIVDDHEDSLIYAKEALICLGYEAICTQKADEALTLAVCHQPDIILLDLLIGPVHGTQVLNQLKAHHTTSHIPVIAVTAMVTELSALKKAKAEFAAYIEKPFMIDELSSCLLDVRLAKVQQTPVVSRRPA